MGAVAELHRYEYPVTAVQFDSRKVVACVGENGIEVSSASSLRDRHELTFQGVQPHDTRTHALGGQRTHQACRADAFHRQVSRQWWARWLRQGVGHVNASESSEAKRE